MWENPMSQEGTMEWTPGSQKRNGRRFPTKQTLLPNGRNCQSLAII